MSWGREREQGYETQFAHAEEQAFKAAAHRNRLLARWAAERMQLRHRETESYVATLVTGDVAHLRGRAIIKTLIEDLKAAGVAISEREVTGAFERFDAAANDEARKR